MIVGFELLVKCHVNYFLCCCSGRQNLACLSFAGGRPIPKRRRFYPGYDEDKVRDDVTFRSYYNKLRNAANSGGRYIRSSKKEILHPISKIISFFYCSLLLFWIYCLSLRKDGDECNACLINSSLPATLLQQEDDPGGRTQEGNQGKKRCGKDQENLA